LLAVSDQEEVVLLDGATGEERVRLRDTTFLPPNPDIWHLGLPALACRNWR
jgi:hypothetical protein